MSNYWRIVCAQCEDSVGHVNHGERRLLDVMRFRAAIEAFGKAQREGMPDDLHIEWGSSGEDWANMPMFFATHSGHELRVRDEYGTFSGNCYERFRCPMCATSHPCGLPLEHDGDHGPAK